LISVGQDENRRFVEARRREKMRIYSLFSEATMLSEYFAQAKCDILSPPPNWKDNKEKATQIRRLFFTTYFSSRLHCRQILSIQIA
jgi:hypothetical protein